MGKRDIREHVAFVMQDDKLLAGTIQQNITGFTASPMWNAWLNAPIMPRLTKKSAHFHRDMSR